MEGYIFEKFFTTLLFCDGLRFSHNMRTEMRQSLELTSIIEFLNHRVSESIGKMTERANPVYSPPFFNNPVFKLKKTSDS